MKKKIIIDGVHEYTIKKTDNKVKLKSSKNESWTQEYRKKTLAKMTDNGNGITISFSDSDQIIELDYHYAFYVKLLVEQIDNL